MQWPKAPFYGVECKKAAPKNDVKKAEGKWITGIIDNHPFIFFYFMG